MSTDILQGTCACTLLSGIHVNFCPQVPDILQYLMHVSSPEMCPGTRVYTLSHDAHAFTAIIISLSQYNLSHVDLSPQSPDVHRHLGAYVLLCLVQSYPMSICLLKSWGAPRHHMYLVYNNSPNSQDIHAYLISPPGSLYITKWWRPKAVLIM